MLKFLSRGVLILAAGTAAALAQRPMTLVDIMNVPQVADPQLSPDGHQVLFVESHLRLGESARQLTRRFFKIFY